MLVLASEAVVRMPSTNVPMPAASITAAAGPNGCSAMGWVAVG
jgi:hypothetical protein